MCEIFAQVFEDKDFGKEWVQDVSDVVGQLHVRRSTSWRMVC